MGSAGERVQGAADRVRDGVDLRRANLKAAREDLQNEGVFQAARSIVERFRVTNSDAIHAVLERKYGFV